MGWRDTITLASNDSEKPRSWRDTISKNSSAEPQERPWYSVTGDGLLQSIKNYGNQLETGARSFNEMITLGASEPITSAANAGIRSLTDDKPFKQAYSEDVDRRRALKDENPLASAVGGLGGALLPVGPAALAAKGVGKLVGSGTKLVSEAPVLKGLLNAGGKVGALANYAGDIASGAAQGAVGSAAIAAPMNYLEEKTGFLKPGEAPSVGELAETGGLLGGGIAGGIPILTKALPAVGKKIMTAALGPSGKNIDYYLKNPEAVNNAKSVEELKGKVDDIVGGLRSKVQSGELSVNEAKQTLKEIQSQANDNVRQSKFDFQVTKTQIRQSFKDASDKLEKEFGQKVSNLKSIKPPTDLTPEVNQSVKELKDKIVRGSGEALNTLEGGSNLNLQESFNTLAEARDRLNIAGVGPVTSQAKSAQVEINNLLEAVKKLPEELSPQETKRLIMQLDRSEKAIYNSGEFSDDVGMAYKNVRRAIDEKLKSQNPEYARQMKQVAKDTGLHSEVAKAFGEERGAYSRLSRIGSPTGELDRGLLSQLGQATGRNFDEPIDMYLDAQRTLKSPMAMARIKQSLPDAKEVQNYKKVLRGLDGPEAQANFVKQNLKSSGLIEKEATTQGLLNKNQEGLLKAKGELEPFSNISETTSEGKIRGLLNNRNMNQIELKKQFSELSKLSDIDFVKAIEDLRVQNAFSVPFKNGSRNVNLWSSIFRSGGGAIAGASVGGGAGAAIGASAGALIDQFGPAMAKQVLDGVLKIKGDPSVQKIMALKVPGPAKAYLINEFKKFQESGGKNE